eukprot:4985907-Lingulodinium_polyedra.AAC.1
MAAGHRRRPNRRRPPGADGARKPAHRKRTPRPLRKHQAPNAPRARRTHDARTLARPPAAGPEFAR